MTTIKNKIIVLGIIFLSFFCFINTTKANIVETSIFEEYRVFADQEADNVCGSAESGCQYILGDPEDPDCPAYWFQWILNVFKYVAIAALLVLSTVDFIKAIINNDKDALKKAGMTAGKRFIFVVLLFFLPIIVDFIMRLFGAYGTCGIG